MAPRRSGRSPARDHRRSETSVELPNGTPWGRLVEDVLTWRVKTRSGFVVQPSSRVSIGDRPVVSIRVLGVRIVEPVEVIEVVEERERAGFVYRTLPGHPVDGEEAFLLDRDGDAIRFIVRSLTRAAPQQPWRALFPLLLVAQSVVRRRYRRALLRERVGRTAVR